MEYITMSERAQRRNETVEERAERINKELAERRERIAKAKKPNKVLRRGLGWVDEDTLPKEPNKVLRRGLGWRVPDGMEDMEVPDAQWPVMSLPKSTTPDMDTTKGNYGSRSSFEPGEVKAKPKAKLKKKVPKAEYKMPKSTTPDMDTTKGNYGSRSSFEPSEVKATPKEAVRETQTAAPVEERFIPTYAEKEVDSGERTESRFSTKNPLGMKRGGGCTKMADGGGIKEFIKDSNEKYGASRVKNMTGPERNIGPKMNRVASSRENVADKLERMELDAVERGKNKEKADINSRTRSAPDFKKGGSVGSASKRADAVKLSGASRGDGCCVKGKTKGRMR